MLVIEPKRSDKLSTPACFGIPAHIHVCITGAGAVILDVRRDKYLGLGQVESEWLADVVAGWPQPLWQRSIGQERPEVFQAKKEFCDSLVADGVLESIPAGKRVPVVVSLGNMRGEWISIGDELEVRGRMTLQHVGRFLAAYTWARYSLTSRSFSAVVEDVKVKKLTQVRDLNRCQLRQLAALVDIFRRLRPWAFAAEGRCLLHALTLVRFLSLYKLHPEWMIGVTMQPWGAHSWVQWDRFLLDSNPEKVCGYTPIMRV